MYMSKNIHINKHIHIYVCIYIYRYVYVYNTYIYIIISIDVPNSHWLVDEKRGAWLLPLFATGWLMINAIRTE